LSRIVADHAFYVHHGPADCIAVSKAESNSRNLSGKANVSRVTIDGIHAKIDQWDDPYYMEGGIVRGRVMHWNTIQL
jgi:hypothetical protein